MLSFTKHADDADVLLFSHIRSALLMVQDSWTSMRYFDKEGNVRGLQASQDWRTLMNEAAAAPSWAALSEQAGSLEKRLHSIQRGLDEAQLGTPAYCKV